MRVILSICALFALLMLAASADAQLAIRPTTTLNQETSNNTSASSLFNDKYNTQFGANTTNGDAVPGNVSKFSIQSLLYPGSTTRVFAHTQSWFCHNPANVANGTLSPTATCGSHIDIGYNSDDPAQVHNQVLDMLSRGIQGAITNWNGPSTIADRAVAHFRTEAENSNGQFEFGVNIDKGAFGATCKNTSSSTPVPACTQDAINVTNYVLNTYAVSPAYIRNSGGRPIILFFVDSGTHPTPSMIDWNQVRSSIGGNPVFVFDNKEAFSYSFSDGAYGWENIGDGNFGLTSLDNFYTAAAANPSKLSPGAAFKGFNDRVASWSGNRVNDQQCGRTWLQTFQVTNKHYSSAHQLDLLGLVTWDDYEEGTELETGIDNCMQSDDGSVSGNTLSWNPVFGTDPLNPSISGDESTVHHYTVFISQDGQNLMVLQDNIASGTHSLDLSQYNIPPGTYTLYVKAVGQPSILNHMSSGISYTASGTGGCMVSISSPANGSNVSSPVRVTATATPTGSNTVTSMEIDVDGSAVYQASNTSSVDQAITMSSGNHTIAVKATDSSGATCQSSVSVTVTGVTVTVSSPANNSNVASPVTISASATSSHTITGWHIYVDGTDSFSAGQVAQINASLPMSLGQHTVIVRAWDSTGAFGDQTLTLNVVAGVAVTVAGPMNNSNVVSPVPVSASASSSHTITGWHIYVDGTDSFSAGQVAQIHANIAMSLGAHTVIVRAWDSTGAFGDQTLTLNVVSGVAVNVTSPANGATVNSPVTISANANSSHPITGWHIYVDSTDVFSGGAVTTISPSISMAAGTHTVIIRAWDSTGAFGDQTLTLTVR